MEINMELLTKEEINNNKFYFLSDKGDFKRIYPRVPRRRMNYEDNETKRICCAKRIYSALQAIPLDKCCDFYVYQLDITKKICRIVMFLSTIAFIYTFALYKGIDLIALVINFFKF